MADIHLTEFAGDEFVFHFGGRPSEVDAYTFANSILAFSEAIREINSQTNPDTKLEITIEGVGEGSFRAKLRATAKALSALLRSSAAKEIARDIVIPLFVAFIYDRYLSDSSTKIVINDDSYIVERGHDRIILPRSIYERRQSLRDPVAIEKHIARGFGVLEDDPSVTEFGITKKIDDRKPITMIPRDDFPILSNYATVQEADEGKQRILEQREKLIVLRAILARSSRKWQFVWNGIKISAPITDVKFYEALARHEYEFGQGDVLDAVLRIVQERDEETGIYINVWYEVVHVFGRAAGPRQPDLPLKP